ncbi:MAG TPA: condensation domain-containing protein, partial [Ktedonobacteraceae bacterium]|nr:condensation domain-containing protein [Ktedonobacteraceae bacterium]
MSIPDFYAPKTQDEVKILPLTPAQKGLWMLDQQPTNGHFNTISTTIIIKKPLDTYALQSSFDVLIQRHAALRTIFRGNDDPPQQVILPQVHIPLPVIDLRTQVGQQREAAVQRLLAEEALQPFDLAQGPLVRACVLWLDAAEYMLLLSTHRMVCDRWSVGICVCEFASLYEAFASDQPSPLLEVSLSYTDFVRQQQAWLQGKPAAEQLSYWEQLLTDRPEGLALPITRRSLQASIPRSAKYDLVLSDTLCTALQLLSQQENVPLEVVLVAALQAVLYRYSGQGDMQIGIGATGRVQTEHETVPGLFENMLVLRTGLSDDLPFRILLEQVHTTLQHMRAHQELPFAYLVEKLHSTHPFFQVLFTLLPPLPALPSGWTIAHMDGGAGALFADIHLLVEAREEELCIQFAYRSDLFAETTIARMAGHWQTLLEGVLVAPETSLASLPLLTEQERHQLLVAWNEPQ